MNKYEKHKYICETLNHIYRSKNHDYGDSFGESFEEFGAISAIVRIDDKHRRLKQLLIHKTDQQVKDESAIDTALDMANYLIMLAMELEGEK